MLVASAQLGCHARVCERSRTHQPPGSFTRRLHDGRGWRPAAPVGHRRAAIESRRLERRLDGSGRATDIPPRACLAGSAAGGAARVAQGCRGGRRVAAASLRAGSSGAHAGKLQLPVDQARPSDRKGSGVRAIQAVLLLRGGRGRPSHDRQADRQPAPRRATLGGRPARSPDLSRQPRAWATNSSRSPTERIRSGTWRECSNGSRRSNGGSSSPGRRAPPSSTCSS